MKRTLLMWLAGVAVLAAAVAPAWRAEAATYADRPIKFIVPWAAGGNTDAIARVFANLLQPEVGQPVVVTNVTGASATVGAREAKSSPPDGYTLYWVHDSIHITYYTGLTDIAYTDFDPACLATFTPSILAASGRSKWSSLKELLEDARRRPGQITVGATPGSTSTFFPALIEREAKVKFRYISYEGAAPRIDALVSGHIDLAESNLLHSDKANRGEIRWLAMATERRHPEAPDLPTLKELGINVVYGVNRGVLLPRGTPERILARLEAACELVVKNPAFAKTMRKQGTDVQFLGRKAYAEFLRKNDQINKTLAAQLGLLKRR